MFFLNAVTSLIPHFPSLGIFLLLVLGTFGLPFPEDTTLILSGFLTAQGVVSIPPTLLIIYPTLLMTDFLIYWSGRRYGRKVVEHRRFQRLISPGRLQRLEEEFGKWGIFVIVLGRQVPGLRAQIFLTAGVVKFPTARFILADAVSALVTITLMAGIGYIGGERDQTWREALSGIGQVATVGLAAVVAVALLLKWLRWRIDRKPDALHRSEAGDRG
jgi:membrane protein DedA with SNARE-associated domain